jgi:branched-subunit amino acid aminotransferase/4-amino-4-deoxychorismate lyase
MTGPVAYLNGRFVPFAEAGLPLHDAGFVSGATVVDNARTYGRRLFRWADHLARFRRDCAACYVPLSATDAELTTIAAELVARNGALLPPDGELQVVTFATPGPLGFYVGDPTNGPPTLGMATYPVPERYKRFAEEGVTLAVAGSHGARDGDLLPPRVKHRSRMLWHVAERMVNDPASSRYRPGAIPVVTNAGVGDTSIGSILVVADGAVYLPPDGAVLDSITLAVVERLCQQLDLPLMTFARLDLQDFATPAPRGGESTVAGRATEVILCGTGFGLVGVREFALAVGVSRRYAFPGPVLTRLRAAFAEEMGCQSSAGI